MEPEFQTFVLSLVSLLGIGFSGLSAYLLKSRCTTIKCCGVHIERKPPPDNVV